MKKTFLIFTTIMMFIASIVFAGEVPEKLKQAFKKQFPGSNVMVWEKKDNVNVAVFTENQTRYQVYFNSDANLLGIARHITISQLPAKPLFAIKQKYGEVPDAAVVEVSIPDKETFYLANIYHKNKIRIVKIYMDGDIEVLRSE